MLVRTFVRCLHTKFQFIHFIQVLQIDVGASSHQLIFRTVYSHLYLLFPVIGTLLFLSSYTLSVFDCIQVLQDINVLEVHIFLGLGMNYRDAYCPSVGFFVSWEFKVLLGIVFILSLLGTKVYRDLFTCYFYNVENNNYVINCQPIFVVFTDGLI